MEVIKFFAHTVKIKAVGISGALGYKKEKEFLDGGANIVVTTLGRFEKHYSKKNIFFSNVKYVVMDEIDTLLDSGLEEVINTYIRVTLAS